MKKNKIIIFTIVILIILTIVVCIVINKKAKKENNENSSNTEIINDIYTQVDKNQVSYQENANINELKEDSGKTRR